MQAIATDKQEKLAQCVIDTPDINDNMFRTYAESLGVDPDQAEETIYKRLQQTYKQSAENLTGGEADEMPSSVFDREELETGIKMEMEHADDEEAEEETEDPSSEQEEHNPDIGLQHMEEAMKAMEENEEQNEEAKEELQTKLSSTRLKKSIGMLQALVASNECSGNSG